MRARSIILTVHRLSSVVVQHGPVSGDAILKNRVTCQSASEGQTGCALVLFRDDPAANADGQVSHPTGRISFDSIADALPFHGAGCARRGVALVEGGVVGLVGGGRRQEIPASSAALGRARRRLRDWRVPLVEEDRGGVRIKALGAGRLHRQGASNVGLSGSRIRLGVRASCASPVSCLILPSLGPSPVCDGSRCVTSAAP